MWILSIQPEANEPTTTQDNSLGNYQAQHSS